jgi:ABC-type anion transport system duplicated permease subunit
MTHKQGFTMLQMLKAIVIGMIAVALITLFCGCKTVTKVVEVEKVRTDTTYITKHQRDSIYVHDSVYLHEYTRGDTVYIEKVRLRTDIKEKLRIDTIYKSKTDTVKVSVQETTVKQESKWKRLGKMIGQMLLVLLMLFAVYCIIKIAQHFEKRLP